MIPAEENHLTGVALAYTVSLLQMLHKILPLGWF